MTGDPIWDEKADSDGLYAIALAILALQRSIDRLGNADAATPMGALEAYGAHMGEKIDVLASAVQDIADTMRASKE
jgi:hypothetical protein